MIRNNAGASNCGRSIRTRGVIALNHLIWDDGKSKVQVLILQASANDHSIVRSTPKF